MAGKIPENGDKPLKEFGEGPSRNDNEARQRKLAVKKTAMKDQASLCQDSPMKKVVDHNKIGSSS
jgi:hypothetical protein